MEEFMAILAECPFCHRKQSAKNKLCKCGADLVKAKRAKKVKYWINFRMPNGKQRRQSVGYSIEEARDADGKRRSQKREHRIFDMLPESNMTFNELTEWYLNLKTVKKLASYDRVNFALNNFNKVFGDQIVGTIIPVNLENYQEKRLEQQMAPATVDLELSIAKTMITKAFDNDMVDGRVLKAFRSVKRKLKKGSNARKRILSFVEYLRLLKAAAFHLKPILKVAFNTGMRISELLELKWSYIDRKAGFIRLPAAVTKEKKLKKIPINRQVRKVLKNIPRAINHDFVFTYKGNPIRSRSGLNHSFKTACKQAGIPCGRKIPDGITFHDIRRTVKTNMLNAGVDKAHRDLILGHSLQGMDSYYIAPDEKSLKKAMEKYTRWLDDQIAHALVSVDHSVDQDAKKD
jgi:integrase